MIFIRTALIRSFMQRLITVHKKRTNSSLQLINTYQLKDQNLKCKRSQFGISKVAANRSNVLCGQWCRSLLSIGGDNLQFFPNFSLFLTLGGMNLDHDFVQVWKFSKDQKKKMQMDHFFPNSSENQRKKKVFTKS